MQGVCRNSDLAAIINNYKFLDVISKKDEFGALTRLAPKLYLLQTTFTKWIW
jgi:hypothetical protein